MIRLLVAILLLAAAPAWAQKNSAPAQSPAVNAQALAEREQALASRATAIDKREAEEIQRRALLEARAAIEDASHSRLEVIGGWLGGIIGLFGVLITVIVLVLAFRTERSAITAAVQAAKDEIQTEREDIARVGEEARIVADGAKAELAQQLSDVRGMIEVIRGHRTDAENMSADLQKAVSAALSGTLASIEQTELLNQADADIGDKAIRDLTEFEFEVRMAAAGANGAYQTVIDLAVTMRQLFPSDHVQATALFTQGWALGELDRRADAIAAYDDLIARFGDSDQMALRIPVAMALFNKGNDLGKLDRRAEAVAVFDDLIARFGTGDQLELREPVARALIGKGSSLIKLGRPADSIATLDEVIARLGKSDEPALREQISLALFNKSCALALQRQVTETIATLRLWVERTGKFDCDAVQTDTDFDPIRADPAFIAFMAEMGCAPAQPD